MKEKRQKKILDIIDKKELFKQELKELSTELYVSEMTIRRDIFQLEKNGLIKILFGGQIIRTTRYNEPNYKYRIYEQKKDKEIMAKIASSLIKDGELIFLDLGSSCYYLARELIGRNVNIVTNWIPNILQLAKGVNTKIINVGGTVDKKELYSGGIFAYQTLGNYKFDKAFIGVGSVSINGIYDFRLEIAQIKKRVLECSKENIVLADHTKFFKSAPILINRFDEFLIKKIVTSNISKIDKKVIDNIKKYGIEFTS